jgi:uncharacterized membrane protein
LNTANTADSRAPAPLPVRTVALGRPFVWLAQGSRDFRRAFGPSVFHGVVVAAGGWIIVALTRHFWPLLPGAVSGFVLVSPILATGLYALSRKLAEGARPTLADVLDAWRRGTRPLIWLGAALALLSTAWVLVSAVLVALFVQTPIVGVEGFLRQIVLSRDSNLFYPWVLLGGVGAALTFAATVVSVPLLVDRDVDLASAVLTSVRAAAENPLPMALWAFLIMLLTALSMATLMIGFVVAIPVVGHATWHVYREVVVTDGVPPRV